MKGIEDFKGPRRILANFAVSVVKTLDQVAEEEQIQNPRCLIGMMYERDKIVHALGCDPDEALSLAASVVASVIQYEDANLERIMDVFRKDVERRVRKGKIDEAVYNLSTEE